MRWMKMLFYFGVMLIMIALGLYLIDSNFRPVSTVLLCFSVPALVIGLTGIVMNNYLKRINQKRTGSSSQRK